MKRILVLIFAFTYLSSCSQVNLNEQVSQGEAKKWRSDLVKLHEKLKERHVDIYRKISKDSLDKEVDLLYEEIPQLNTGQILVRISQIVAKIGDGHTSFYPGNQKKKWFGFFPVKFWQFPDGIYVISTTEAYKEFLGQRLIKIENTPIDEVFDKLSTTIGADNDMEYIYSIPFLIPRPEFLHVLGITPSSDKAEFHFENGSATLYSMTLKKWRDQVDYICANEIYPNGKSPSQRIEFLFATRFTLDSLKERRYYWFTHRKNENALFLQYNQCWDQKNRPTFATVNDNMFKRLDETNAERLIIDLRQNTGGEPLIAKPLIEELQKRKKYVDEGRVFVLVGRRTFSAALTNAAQLRQLGVRTVGEAPRGKPNNPSEGRDIDLKSTKIWATVSTQFLERDPALGDQDYLPIDIKCAMTFDDYQKANDEALKKALEAKLFDKKH